MGSEYSNRTVLVRMTSNGEQQRVKRRVKKREALLVKHTASLVAAGTVFRKDFLTPMY
jgi:hypothetical protein